MLSSLNDYKSLAISILATFIKDVFESQTVKYFQIYFIFSEYHTNYISLL